MDGGPSYWRGPVRERVICQIRNCSMCDCIGTRKRCGTYLCRSILFCPQTPVSEEPNWPMVCREFCMMYSEVCCILRMKTTPFRPSLMKDRVRRHFQRRCMSQLRHGPSQLRPSFNRHLGHSLKHKSKPLSELWPLRHHSYLPQICPLAPRVI